MISSGDMEEMMRMMVDIICPAIRTEEGTLMMMAVGMGMDRTRRGVMLRRRTWENRSKFRYTGQNVRSR